MTDEDARRRILARRARLVGAALAAAACSPEARPAPCLDNSIVIPPAHDPDAALTAPADAGPEDTGAPDTGAPETGTDSGKIKDAGPRPSVCLSYVRAKPSPKPRICLDFNE